MKYLSWVRMRAGRIPVIVFAIIVYLLLLNIGGLRFIPSAVENPSSLASFWFRFGFSSLIALLFLAVSCLVWLFARDRRVALLLFSCSFTMMITFVVQIGSGLNDVISSILGGVSSLLTLALFAIFLLLFPRDHLSQILARENRHLQPVKYRLLRAYVVLVGLLCIPAIAGTITYYLQLPLANILYNFVLNFYVLFALTGIISTIVVSYRKLPTLRERQQVRLFMGGVVLAFAPFLLLTILPGLLQIPSKEIVDAQVSTLSAFLLPLALGYSILRYQILVFDMYIRRVVTWVVGVLSLIVLGYLAITFSSLAPWSQGTAHVVVIAIALAVLAPSAWWLAHVLTERIFFSEIRYYRRIIDKPTMLARETFDIDEAATLLTLALVHTFEIGEVCLFVFDQETGQYQLSPPLHHQVPQDAARRRVAQRIIEASSLIEGVERVHGNIALFNEGRDWLSSELPLFANVASSRRPLLLSEAAKAEGELPVGLARYLSTSTSDEDDPLLIPVRAQGKMVALLVLGARSDGQQYAGPDFEVIELILSRFASVLETARLYQQAHHHAMTLNALYSGGLALEKNYQSIDEAIGAYATVAAGATKGGAEVWLYTENEHMLKRVLHVGEGPLICDGDRLQSSHDEDWNPYFYIGADPHAWQGPSAEFPACLPRTPCFPFAWLPLTKGDQRYGVLALTFPRPHLFLEEDRRVLSMFASHCAAVTENTQITIALRDAYERQKELDNLKDQFIMTASHELRTPLTAVQGYIELLFNYNERLNAEERANFIAKAQRGCDELVLMVGNIMDSSRMEVDINEVSLVPVSLVVSVSHILEIMEGVTRRENREVRLDVLEDIVITADELRLRQIILNLVGNAVKYSPTGSPIHITASVAGGTCTVRIRDYGLGISPADQARLFERFVRLERDMNSPVRGVGLGLYISKQLVEAMGGHIWVESSGKAGEGSVFAFSLKLYQTARALAS